MKNPGKKFKIISFILMIIGIVASVGVALLNLILIGGAQIRVIELIMPIGIAVIGTLLSLIGGFILMAIGEAIKRLSIIAVNTAKDDAYNSNIDELLNMSYEIAENTKSMNSINDLLDTTSEILENTRSFDIPKAILQQAQERYAEEQANKYQQPKNQPVEEPKEEPKQEIPAQEEQPETKAAVEEPKAEEPKKEKSKKKEKEPQPEEKTDKAMTAAKERTLKLQKLKKNGIITNDEYKGAIAQFNDLVLRLEKKLITRKEYEAQVKEYDNELDAMLKNID